MIGFEIEREWTAVQVPAGTQERRDSVGEQIRENDWKIEQTIAFMRGHLDRPVQVAELATLANVSPSHYFVLFKRRVGCAPIDFFIRLRMHQARRLLETTSLNVKEVAAALGYDDPFYFSRIFKSVNGLPPSSCRLRTNGSDSTGSSETRLLVGAFPSAPSSALRQAGNCAPDDGAGDERNGGSSATAGEITGKHPEATKKRNLLD